MGSGGNVFQGLLNAVAFQTMSLSNSTAVAVNSTVRAARPDVLHISVETNDVRYRADGTNPTLTTGVLLQSDADHWFPGYDRTSVFKFQRSTGTSKVSIMAYRRKGN